MSVGRSVTRESINTTVKSAPEHEVVRGKAHFRPRARLLRTLGYELITNELIAIQELVKNAYDADAHHVLIAFEGPLLLGQGAITIADDGIGMSLETVLTAWMEPATISKIRSKVSASARRVTGEKGIGRFASSRIANVLEMTTISAETGKAVRARFDWGRFDDEDRYLDEVECEWEEQPAHARRPGTELRLIGLRDDWASGTGSRIGGLRGELSRLVSPLAPPADFGITLELPEPFERYAGTVSPPAFLGKPHYWLVGRVDADGVIDAVYSGPNGDTQILEHGEMPRVLIKERPPMCGPFSFEFRVWDRSQEDLRSLAKEFGSTLRDLRKDLDAASGISIYRDSFRVLLPANADWLRLDLRRVQNPTLRISNNQVVGVVSITRDNNPGLVDQTNRQGIVDTPAFDDFRASVTTVLSKLEVMRDTAKRPTTSLKYEPGIFGKLSVAPVRDYVALHHPRDAALKEIVEATEQSITQGVAHVKTVLVRYRRLATLGQLVDGILHEGRTPLGAINSSVRFLERDLASKRPNSILTKPAIALMGKRFGTILQQTELLGDLFRRIAPFSGRQRGRPQTIAMEHILADTVALLRSEIQDAGISVELPEGETMVTVDQADMQGIFRNLIENAVYWTAKVPSEERIFRISLEQVPGELAVVVADNGPGVAEETRDRIMDPYFTTKPDGEGLGLALAGELAAEYDGSLDLLAEGPLNGATFRVTLRRRVG